MSHGLRFARRIAYDAGDESIPVRVELALGSEKQTATAKLDTGSSHCVFRREIGERLGLRIEEGDRMRVGTVTGTFEAYGHPVTLRTGNVEVDSIVYFAAHHDFPRNVLGRHGFLDRFRIGVVDYDGLLYLSRYDDED